MSSIFYLGDNESVHGPFTELGVQSWYINSYFTSEIRFQISSSGKFNPNERIYTLGELINLNGRLNPFYFCSEKENREKKIEDDLAQLIKEVESLRKNNLSTLQSEKDTMLALQTQISALVESNANLQDRVDALSKQIETSPVTSQLEKKVTDLKKRVDEQEKNVVSMKKEISAINSKCDRTESKLEKLIARQDKTEETVNGYDKRISDLKTAEKSIRECVSVCEQSVESSSSQLRTITGDLSSIKMEMTTQKQNCAGHREELNAIHECLDEMDSSILSQMKVTERELRREIDAVKEATRKAVEEQLTQNDDDGLASSAAPSSSTPPLESQDAEAANVADKADKQRVLPLEEADKEERAPVEGTGEVDAKDDDIPPWERAKREKERKESRKEESPWMKESGSTISQSEPLVEEEKSSKESTIEQKQAPAEKVPDSVKEAATDTKPVSRVKDWAAICRDLSDDEEEAADDDRIAMTVPTKANVSAWTDIFIHKFVELLRVYCEALNVSDLKPLMSADNGFAAMLDVLPSDERKMVTFKRIRAAIVAEVRRLAATTIYCGVCNFTMTTPRHLLYHFLETNHNNGNFKEVTPLSTAYNVISATISSVFLSFIQTAQEIGRSLKPERQLNAQGRERIEELRPELDDCRPTEQFMGQVVDELTALAPTHFRPDGDELQSCSNAASPMETVHRTKTGNRKRELATAVKAYFACMMRKRAFDQKFRAHMAEPGVIACSGCVVAFVNVEQYFQHVFTYEHAREDQSIFAMCLQIWKGNEYWEAML